MIHAVGWAFVIAGMFVTIYLWAGIASHDKVLVFGQLLGWPLVGVGGMLIGVAVLVFW